MSFKIISNAGSNKRNFYKSVYTQTNNQTVKITAGNTGDLSLTCPEGILLYNFDFFIQNQHTTLPPLSSVVLITISKGKSKSTAISVQDYTYSAQQNVTLHRTENISIDTDFNTCLFVEATVSLDTDVTLKTTLTRLPNNTL